MSLSPLSRLLHGYLIARLYRLVDAYRLSVKPYYRRLAQLSSYHKGLSVHREIELLTPLREQAFVGEACLQSGIHQKQMSVVIQLYPLSVKIDKDEIVLLIVEIKTDTDGSHEKGVSVGLSVIKLDLLKLLFSP